MPRPRIHATNKERQAAYRARCSQRESQAEVAKPDLHEAKPSSPRKLTGRWDKMIRQAHSILDQVAQEMGVYCEDRSEEWQCSDRGESFTERLDSIEEVIAMVNDLLES